MHIWRNNNFLFSLLWNSWMKTKNEMLFCINLTMQANMPCIYIYDLNYSEGHYIFSLSFVGLIVGLSMVRNQKIRRLIWVLKTVQIATRRLFPQIHNVCWLNEVLSFQYLLACSVVVCQISFWYFSLRIKCHAYFCIWSRGVPCNF